MVWAFSVNPFPAIAFISPLRCEDTGAVGVSKEAICIFERIE